MSSIKNGSVNGKAINNSNGPPRRSLRFERRLSLQSSGAGGVGYLHRLSKDTDHTSKDRSVGRRKSSGFRKGSSRWNRRRTLSRRLSRLPSEDLNEFELIAYYQAGSSLFENERICFRFISARMQGLILSLLCAFASFLSTLCSSILIMRNYLLVGMSSLVQFNCSRRLWSKDGELPSFFEEVVISKNGPYVNCSATDILAWYSNKYPKNLTLFTLPSTHEKIIFINPYLLWTIVVVSLAFLWSSWLLLDGVWNYRRRKLVPWLLIIGVGILFLIMSAVWILISSKGYNKLYTLIPSGLAILLLYWWCVINILLEEIHNNKKMDAKADAEAEAAEAGVRMKTEINSRKEIPYEMSTNKNLITAVVN
ncbi:uncharacterized protein [Lepeophtheirus salmonis]|uniref:uncharacterized protein n=1 Tax=Lepeophtheirus salmonis TaxID=72036 RepID=UPI003AF3CA3C